jgi:PAS domain S-box-containing protein
LGDFSTAWKKLSTAWKTFSTAWKFRKNGAGQRASTLGRALRVKEAKMDREKNGVGGGTGQGAGTNADLARIQRMEEDLARAAEERGILLDNIPTQVWYLTDPRTYGAVNEAHAAFFGVRKEDLAYRDIGDFMPPAEVDICCPTNRAVFENARVVRTEEWVRDGEGNMRLLAIQRSPKLRADGSVEYVVCAAEDITDRHRAETELNAKVKELEDFYEIAVGRELKMVELKRQVNELCRELGRPAPWDLSGLQEQEPEGGAT